MTVAVSGQSARVTPRPRSVAGSPTDPTQPTGPTQPTDQTEPTDPTEPTDQVGPTGPADVVDAAGSAGAADDVDTATARTGDPADATDPADAADRAEATNPADPADGVDPTCAPARRPGRPRERRADHAIIGSALEIFAEDGYHALTIEAVAARAGVGKTTIYRRWPGKKELVIDALATLNDELMTAKAHLPDAAADRIRAVLRHLTTRDNESLLGRITPRMLVYSESQPDLYADYFDRVIRPRRRWLHRLLQEGVQRGELRADLDIEVAALTLVGAALMPARGLGWDEHGVDLADRLFDVLWPAFRADAEPTVSG